jgi:hypothetical protein
MVRAKMYVRVVHLKAMGIVLLPNTLFFSKIFCAGNICLGIQRGEVRCFSKEQMFRGTEKLLGGVSVVQLVVNV